MTDNRPHRPCGKETPHTGHWWHTTHGTGLRFYPRRVWCKGIRE